MLRESLHLQRLVDDLLELTRLQNADFRIEKAPLELRQLAEDVRRSARRLAEPKGRRPAPGERRSGILLYRRLWQTPSDAACCGGQCHKIFPSGRNSLYASVPTGRRTSPFHHRPRTGDFPKTCPVFLNAFAQAGQWKTEPEPASAFPSPGKLPSGTDNHSGRKPSRAHRFTFLFRNAHVR